MTLRAWLGRISAAAWLGAGPAIAAADRPIAVELDAAPVVDRTELTAALRVRIPATGEPVRVRVTRAAQGARDGVLVEVRGTSRWVGIGERRGEEAARLIALAASDLLLDDLATAPPDPVRAAPATWSLAALGEVSAWTGGELGSAELSFVDSRGPWLGLASLGGGQLFGAGFHATTATVRLGAGRRVGPLELSASAVAVPISVPDGAGDRTVLLGGGLAARWRLPLTARLGVVLAAGVDAFATRSEYAAAGASLGATPWVAPWIAAGIGGEP